MARIFSSTSSVLVVIVIVHILDDLQVELKVVILEVFVLLLVLSCLIEVSLADVLHGVDSLLERRDGFIVVLCEAQLLLVSLDLVEALNLEICTLKT